MGNLFICPFTLSFTKYGRTWYWTLQWWQEWTVSCQISSKAIRTTCSLGQAEEVKGRGPPSQSLRRPLKAAPLLNPWIFLGFEGWGSNEWLKMGHSVWGYGKILDRDVQKIGEHYTNSLISKSLPQWAKHCSEKELFKQPVGTDFRKFLSQQWDYFLIYSLIFLGKIFQEQRVKSC